MTPEEMKDEFLQAEEKAHTALRDVMRICWHHTKDPDGEQKSIREYARIVGRSFSVIQRYVNGYKLLLADPINGVSPGDMTPTEACFRAGMSDEKEAATEEVAKVAGITFTTAAQRYRPETTQTQSLAKERAQEHGTTPREELPAAAQTVVDAAKARASVQLSKPPVSAVVAETSAQPKVARTVPYDMARRALETETGVTHMGDTGAEQIAHVRRLAQTMVTHLGSAHEDAAKDAARLVAIQPTVLKEIKEETGKRNHLWSGNVFVAPPVREAMKSLRQAVHEAERTYCHPTIAALIGEDLFEIEQLVSRVRSLISAPRVSPGKPQIVKSQTVIMQASPGDAGLTKE